MNTRGMLLIAGAGVGLLWYLSRCDEASIDALAKRAVESTKGMHGDEAARMLVDQLPRVAPKTWAKCRTELFRALGRNGLPPFVILSMSIAMLNPASTKVLVA